MAYEPGFAEVCPVQNGTPAEVWHRFPYRDLPSASRSLAGVWPRDSCRGQTSASRSPIPNIFLGEGGLVPCFLQGSALWRTPDPASTKIQLNGGRHTGSHSAKAGVYLDASLSFATQNSSLQTVFARKHRLRPVRARARVRAMGLEGVSHTCRGFSAPKGTHAVAA
jgi:hypothetical protein